jgi:membrane protease YdiL (CAAX protease family)
MKKGILAEANPATQLLFVGLVFIGSWIVFQLLGMLSGMFIFNLNLQDVAYTFESINDKRMIGFLKYVQAITSIGMFIFSAIAAAYFIDYDWKNFLGLNKKPKLKVVLISALFIIIILPFTNFLTEFNSNLHLPQFMGGLEDFFREKEEQMTKIMESFLQPSGMIGLLVNLFVIAVIPAIGEELTFRGIIQKVLLRWFKHPHWAIIVTAFLFSAMHFQFLSFLPRFFLGLVLGYIYIWSGSIWLSILIHFINNAMAVIFYNFYYGGEIGNYMEKVGTSENGMPWALVGVIAGLGLLYLIYKDYKYKSSVS